MRKVVIKQLANDGSTSSKVDVVSSGHKTTQRQIQRYRGSGRAIVLLNDDYPNYQINKPESIYTTIETN